MVQKAQNFHKIKSFFTRKLEEIGYNGVFGAAKFKSIYYELMPVQRRKLRVICSERFSHLMRNGTIICIGIAHHENAINSIDARLYDGSVDKETWNLYAREYHKINKFLNVTAREIADSFGGIPVPATLEGTNVKRVEEYFGMTISHRVVAENAGVG